MKKNIKNKKQASFALNDLTMYTLIGAFIFSMSWLAYNKYKSTVGSSVSMTEVLIPSNENILDTSMYGGNVYNVCFSLGADIGGASGTDKDAVITTDETNLKINGTDAQYKNGWIINYGIEDNTLSDGTSFGVDGGLYCLKDNNGDTQQGNINAFNDLISYRGNISGIELLSNENKDSDFPEGFGIISQSWDIGNNGNKYSYFISSVF